MTDVPAHVHEFDWPDRVVIGTVGRPGARTFYLQVRQGTQLVSIALEKQQSALLAEKIDEILDHLLTVESNRFSVPTSTPVELVDNDQLETSRSSSARDLSASAGIPPRPRWSSRRIPSSKTSRSEEDIAAESEMLRVRMPVGTARAFTQRTREIVDAGRPFCSLCGYPMDPDGHTCTLPEI